uniref:UBZ2-type domain-containing protein n=2 Tax=Chinchilla lanigera TaxID=34839 RepID=A0A8C2UW95_CHILA
APSGGPQCPPSSVESEPWGALMRAVRADPILDRLPLPPLPTFPSQELGPELPAVAEVFTVGTKAFTWTPFPPAGGGPGLTDKRFQGAAVPPGSPAPSLEGQHVSDLSGTPRPLQQLTKEEPLALRSCPLCQKEFTPELTQLDVDSHLAQCLAESTEDVEW